MNLSIASLGSRGNLKWSCSTEVESPIHPTIVQLRYAARKSPPPPSKWGAARRLITFSRFDTTHGPNSQKRRQRRETGGWEERRGNSGRASRSWSGVPPKQACWVFHNTKFKILKIQENLEWLRIIKIFQVSSVYHPRCCKWLLKLLSRIQKR